jgi:hypothetical protein
MKNVAIAISPFWRARRLEPYLCCFGIGWMTISAALSSQRPAVVTGEIPLELSISNNVVLVKHIGGSRHLCGRIDAVPRGHNHAEKA